MAKSVKNATNCPVAEAAGHLEAALKLLINPVAQALKESPSRPGPDGKEPIKDMRLRILLGGILAHLHRQTFGVITTADGRSIRNARDWLKHSDDQATRLVAKYESDPSGMSADPEYLTVGAWCRTNDTFFAAADALFNRVAQVYADTIGEEWKPMERKAPPAQPTVTADKGAIAAAFAKAGERKSELLVRA